MKSYLVGGAVRDKLLGVPVLDRDWVVVGETPSSMLAAGFTAVGKDFPVFLHPETHEEYALARTERKTGPGYHGFEIDSTASVTLEEDLLRRDLTVNAIAEAHDGHLIDPFDGQHDIEQRVLKHVSPAFSEDPVRVLRVAKFMARFCHLGFSVDAATINLMQSMVVSGEVNNLVAERVWQELEAALNSQTPRAFFETLHKANALECVLPELAVVLSRSVQSPSATGSNTADTENTKTMPMLDALDAACLSSKHPHIRFAALCAGFSPGSAPLLDGLCQRLRVPNTFAELALLAARFAPQAHQALQLDAIHLQSLLRSLDAIRRPARFHDFLVAARAHASTDTPFTIKQADDHYPQAAHLMACAKAMASIDAGKIAKSQANKMQISTVIKQHEIDAIDALLNG